jgi:[methyl-Co(III) methanol-specific corrinoid protein]:coenzyme M methyltransferase
VPFEASVDASAFGAVTSHESERRQPAITGRPITSRELADIVRIPDPRRDGRAPVVLEAVSMLRQRVGNESPVLCGAISAFTLASQLRGEADALMDLVIDTVEHQHLPSPGLMGGVKDFFKSLFAG